MNAIKFIFLLFLFFLQVPSIWAQSWEKHYALGSFNRGMAITQTLDQGYAIVSETSLSAENITFLKMDEEGEKLVHNYLGIGTDSYEYPRDVIQLSNGNYLIVGTSEEVNNGDPDMYFEEGIRLVQLSDSGELLSNQLLGVDTVQENANAIIPTSDDAFLVVGSSKHRDSLHKDLLLMKIDVDGNEIWSKNYGGIHDDIAFDVVETTDGDFMITGIGGKFENGQAEQSGILVMRVNNVGDLELLYNWEDAEAQYSEGKAIIATQNGGYAITGKIQLEAAGGGLTDGMILRLDEQGNALGFSYYQIPAKAEFFDIVEAPNGDLLSIGNAINFANVTNLRDVYLVRTDATGDELWTQFYGDTEEDKGQRIISSNNQAGFVLAGTYGNPELLLHTETYVIKTDSLGNTLGNLIQGQVFIDVNENCEKDTSETNFLAGRLVQAIGENTFYTFADENGFYEMELPNADYTLSLVHPSHLWGSDCMDVPASLMQDTIVANLPATVVADCPYLRIEISAPFLRRCFDNNYTVYFENKGTAIAENAYIEIEFDEFQTILDADLPFTLDNQLMTVELGDLPVDSTGNFKIYTHLSCDAVLGQSHCVEAHIFPDTICIPPSPIWDGSTVELKANCDEDEFARFKIVNTGDDMEDSLQYIVIEDALLLAAEQGKFKLDSGDSTIIIMPATGATWRMQAQQSVAHPSNNFIVSAHLEGCDADGDQQFSLGFVTLFEENDREFYKSIDCQENIGSFDPNDKRAFPVGLTEEHCIDSLTVLDYHIRFQNTGTDTAFRVVIRDTLSQFLDVSSIQFGAASHDYRVEILEGHILKFIFDDIQLPDSSNNEIASHGFIRFKISQQIDNQINTIIKNRAAIYFDFNEPVITNEVFHTIGDCHAVYDFVPTAHVFKPNTRIEVFPNPAFDLVHFKIEGIVSNDFEIEIYDVAGKFINRYFMTNQELSLNRNNLSSGIYFYKISNYLAPLKNS